MRLPLTECFIEVLVAIEELRDKALPSEPAAVVRHLIALVENAAQQALACHYDSGDIDLARFAVCAWADEVLIAATGGNRRPAGVGTLLQRRFYDTADAGALFFSALHRQVAARPAPLAVYRLCLALGFRGARGDATTADAIPAQNSRRLPCRNDTGLPAMKWRRRPGQWRRVLMVLLAITLLAGVWLLMDASLSAAIATRWSPWP